MNKKTYHRVLTIAGSDSGGGAGIQPDLKTFAANGCYGMSVITALTAQNTQGVRGIHPVPIEFVAQQMDAVLSDIGADAIKIGMLYSAELVATVAAKLEEYDATNIVVDPVMVAQSGDKLLRDDAVAALKEKLIPLAEIITPNLPEAAHLLGREIESETDMADGAKELAQLGCRHVLIKGGHAEDANESADYLYSRATEQMIRLGGPRLETRNNHGTGCTLSSAIAARLAQGDALEMAVRRAKDYITAAIQLGASYQIGQGHGPVHHFWGLWK